MATTYFVDQERGSNANDGLRARRAKKTLAAATALLGVPGDVLMVAPGIYAETSWMVDSLCGTSSHPIRILAQQELHHRPILAMPVTCLESVFVQWVGFDVFCDTPGLSLISSRCITIEQCRIITRVAETAVALESSTDSELTRCVAFGGVKMTHCHDCRIRHTAVFSNVGAVSVAGDCRGCTVDTRKGWSVVHG